MAGQEVYSPLPPWQRTAYCGTLRAADAGREVALLGWVQTRRDHGSLIFIDLRDHAGLIQLVLNPATSAEAHDAGADARSEYFVAARGKVVLRSEGTVNPELPTGQIEVLVSDFEIVNSSAPPPFPIGDEDTASEDVRLRYRYLDLRRPTMQRNLRARHQAVKAIRDFLDDNGFVEVETPILWKSTPEGARDYLVPSRVNPGKFYALPQSPQLLKQILMIGGLDRYYQIARCFRDEDLRANRQPEFSQIDIEMTCPRPEDIQSIAEGMIASVYRSVLDVDVRPPFPRMPHAEAIERFGIDKPDLRFGMELKNLTNAFAGTSFKVFAEILARGESVYGINVSAEHTLTRRELDELTETVKSRHSMGLAWIKVGDAGWQGPDRKVPERQRESRGDGGRRTQDRRHAHDGRGTAGDGAPGARRYPLAARRDVRSRQVGRAQVPVGRRFPDVRVQRRRQAHELREPSVHRAASRRSRAARFGAAQGPRAGLRHGAQRPGARRRFDSYP